MTPSNNSFAKDVPTASSNTFSADTPAASSNSFAEDKPVQGLNAWEGDGITSGAPPGEMFSGDAPGINESGGIAHLKRTLPEISH